jgi:valyl-tRNA synthetase
LITGFDILFFWVARMIMLGCWFAADVPNADGSKRELKNAVPFREVYIHALVRDANREKMSKTKGNVVDPIEIVKTYGTDAVRFTLASMASPGTDIAFNVARTEGYRAFANKIWNAARFLFMNVDRAKEAGIEIDLSGLSAALKTGHDNYIESRWIRSRLSRTAALVNTGLSEYRFDEAASLVYQFFWGDFCDWYLEIVKLRLDFVEKIDILSRTEALKKLLAIFDAALRLLSPFMPFLTEEIWHALHDEMPPKKSIALTRFPVAEDARFDEIAISDMETLKELIVTIRALRKDLGVPEKEAVAIKLHCNAHLESMVESNLDIFEKLARVSDVEMTSEQLNGVHARGTAYFDVAVLYERTIDTAAERERLAKEIAQHEKIIENGERQLGNEGFLVKAPAHVVEGLKKQVAEHRALLEKARAALEKLNEDD